MCSRCKALQCLGLFLAITQTLLSEEKAREERGSSQVLRVAADPNNLPFSNESGQGFENRIMELAARKLGMKIEYVWHAQRRGFFRETLKAGLCDVIPGVPAGFERALLTIPYYHSGYAMVFRSHAFQLKQGLADPQLPNLRIGVQLVGDDGANTPPAHALAARGLIRNVVGYTLYGDYREPSPPARIVHDVWLGKIDVAFVWGPLAGYFAAQEKPALSVQLLEEPESDSALPMDYQICMGVRRNDPELRDKLNEFIRLNRDEIEAILDSFHMVRVAKDARIQAGPKKNTGRL